MAISYVGGNSLGQAGVTATTDITISLTALTGGSDSAAAAGDLVIVALGVGDADGVDGSMTETSGTYTVVADVFAGAAATNEANLGVFYKFLTGADASVSVRSNLGNDAGISVAVMVFRGVKPVASGGPFDVAAVPTSGTGTGAIDPPQIDTTGTAGIWTVIAGTRAIATHTGALAGPTNYTVDFIDAPGGADTTDAKTGMGYNSAPSDPENPGTMVWAGTEASTDSWCAVTMALSEAATVASGDLAATEAVDTAALAGDVIVKGTLASTEAVDVAALAGDVIVAGDLAVTEATDTLAAIGTVASSEIAGDLATTEAADVAALAGDVLVAGTFAATEVVDVAAADGDVIVAGTAAAVEAIDVAALAGDVLVLGDFIVTEAADIAAFLGPAGALGEIQYWTGAVWAAKPVKVWQGGAWTVKPLKRWNGAEWVITP